MTTLLLDHPWRLDDTLDPASGGFRLLEQFVELIRRTGLEPVRFVADGEYNEMWGRIEHGRFARTRAYALLASFAQQLVCNDDVAPLATPMPEPPLLTPGWKRGLRGAMADLKQWRAPQIIIGETRENVWPNTPEVKIKLEDNNGAAEQLRVLAQLTSYDLHPFALSDFDPWDLTRTHPPSNGGERQYPCRLPRPPCVEGAWWKSLDERVDQARTIGWRVGDRYYFVPPSTWEKTEVKKEQWRKGRAFPCEQCPGRDNPGPIDYGARVWIWDRRERHWDVQLPHSYIRVSHTGEEL